MKTSIFILFSFTASSQNFTYTSTFQALGDSTTGETIEIQGKAFGVFQTASGSLYIKSVSKSGNMYPVWIGLPTEFIHDGHKVRVSKKGTYFVLVLNESGKPFARYLKESMNHLKESGEYLKE